MLCFKHELLMHSRTAHRGRGARVPPPPQKKNNNKKINLKTYIYIYKTSNKD